ncbi:hypothetical protein N658DRAFT_516410 [Parathielavia hyrcaniae]|uniref:Mg2+ transporter protein, CorA-like/Zinc transport protein ZntB n=1 Tax=Parathielavia hyrcaniae TaxID=113614 RepID=A0AAN6PZN3_9PEZI|nr:hypothetical protein N658DRAFT_516410 [Parathielavia hyrcaniae]
MDNPMFRANVESCKRVEEATSYLEIFNYSEHRFGSDAGDLTDEFGSFLHRRARETPTDWQNVRPHSPPPTLPDGVHLVGGVRLVLQLNAKDPYTFETGCISLPHEQYKDMVLTMHLPFCAVEGTGVVGPFFWAASDWDQMDPHLQIIFRKSNVRSRGLPRGWELMLSHSFRTNITMGYAKGTPSFFMLESIKHLRACAQQKMILHPLFLPLVVLSHDLSSTMDRRQRDAREWLHVLENAISMRGTVSEEASVRYVRDNMIDVDTINLDLAECHSQVLRKRPQAYQEVITGIYNSMDHFWGRASAKLDSACGGADVELEKLHHSMLARLDFYSAKLKGIETYANVTLERLTIQRAVLRNIIAQKDSKLALQLTGEQRRLAQRAGRESTSMISLFGAIFLPATYLASIISVSFFNFTPNDNTTSAPGGGNEGWLSVTSQWWIYFAITVPLTLLLARFQMEDMDIEAGIEMMEAHIMAAMRKKTLSKARTLTANP